MSDDQLPEGTTVAEGIAHMKNQSQPGREWWEEPEDEGEEDSPESVQDELNIGRGVDPLRAFLDVDRSKPPTAAIRIPRLDTQVTVMAITDSRKHERMVQHCQKEYKVRGQRREELDADKLAKMLVAEYTLWPPFRKGLGVDEDRAFKKMAKKYGIEVPEILVERALYPGEIQKLADAIMELGGFDTERELAKK